MPKIGPTRTADELRESAVATYEGKGHPGLPGVDTDAWSESPNGAFVTNGELAEAFKAITSLAKGSRGGKPLFVIGWRMYPNKECPYWSKLDSHACSCGCACSTHKRKRGKAPPPPGRRGARPKRKK
ncbi:MAG TPA: hypothetical protein VN823_00060 [Stellaceae bacterium]|nr:hypothetical protein [Stellaceae bacterium]